MACDQPKPFRDEHITTAPLIFFKIFIAQNPVRRFLLKFVSSSKFEVSIMVVIVLNMFVMMIKHDGQSADVDYALNIL